MVACAYQRPALVTSVSVVHPFITRSVPSPRGGSVPIGTCRWLFRLMGCCMLEKNVAPRAYESAC